MWWVFLDAIFVLGLITVDNCLAQQIKTMFSCDGRISGYYADVSTGCQVYHMCDGLGRQFSYTCPNATLFQQRMLICDHWYMVNCSRAEQDYSANLLIGQHKPFVDEKEYSRTPRPDLLSAPNESELNIIYRTGRQQGFTTKNVVGLETEEGTPTDEPTYFPPSHWYTSLTPQSSTEHPRRIDIKNQLRNRIKDSQRSNSEESKTSGETRTRAKAIDFNTSNNINNNFGKTSLRGKPSNTPLSNKAVVNFNSNFKATTPVYPTVVEDTPSDLDLLPPIPILNSRRNSGVNIQEVSSGRISVNNPRKELPTDQTLDNNNRHFVVFESNFKATTPVYPTSVEPTSPDPGETGLLAPQNNDKNIPVGGDRLTNQYNNKFATVDKTELFEPPISNRKSDERNENVANDETGSLALQDNDKDFSEGTPSFPVNFESKFKATTPVYPTSVDPTSPDPAEAGLAPPADSKEKSVDNQSAIHINFESKFKATTPVYPTSVEPTSPDPGEAGLLPPQGEADNKPITVFASNFTATTPVYPRTVEPTSPNPNDAGLEAPQQVNFQSNFKATTPVYPTHVDHTSQEPGEAGVLPPEGDILNLNLGFVPPPFNENYKEDTEHNVETTAVPPSKFYQAPKLDPIFAIDDVENEAPGIRILNFMKSFNLSQWQDLRKAFSIPEYDFPLDDATRPSYDSVFDSFDAKSQKKR